MRNWDYKVRCQLDLVDPMIIEYVPRWGGTARVMPRSLIMEVDAWHQDGQTGEQRRWAVAVHPADGSDSEEVQFLREYDFQITPIPTWLLKIIDGVRMDVDARGG